jgi:hypothetical protein
MGMSGNDQCPNQNDQSMTKSQYPIDAWETEHFLVIGQWSFGFHWSFWFGHWSLFLTLFPQLLQGLMVSFQLGRNIQGG